MTNKTIFSLSGISVPLAGAEVIPIWNGTTTQKVSISDLTAGRNVSMANAIVGAGGTTNFGTNVTLNGTNNTANGAYILGQRNTSNNWIIGDTQALLGSGTGLATWVYGVNSYYIYTNGALALTVSGTQNITFSVGNLIQGTAAKGINFTANTPAAGMTSQLLNWYEEGTWTATLRGSVSDPTTPVTAVGRYTRVGRMVTISVSFDNVDTTGASGDVTVTGIPYNNSAPNTRVSGVVGYLGNFPIANKYVACGMDENATAVYFNDIAGIGYGGGLQHSAGGGRYLRFEITYYAA